MSLIRETDKRVPDQVEDQVISLDGGNNDENSQNDSEEWCSHMDKNIWYRLCRICALHNDFLIPIYEGEGLEHELPSKISEYFPFKVSENDGLPKYCCHLCVSMLLSWNDLIIRSKRANEKLNEMLNCFISDNTPTDKESEVAEDKQVEDTDKNESSPVNELYCDVKSDFEMEVCDDNCETNSDINKSEIEDCLKKDVEQEDEGNQGAVAESEESPAVCQVLHSLNDEHTQPRVGCEINVSKVEQDIGEDELRVDVQGDGSVFDLQNDDDHIATVHRLADGNGKTVKNKKDRRTDEPELQAYKLHVPMKYLSVNGHQFLRTKVFGFEPNNAPEGSKDIDSMYFVCCLCKSVMKDVNVISHSKSHYPLKLTDSCQICHFGFGSIDYFRNHLKRHTVYIDEEYKNPVKDEKRRSIKDSGNHCQSKIPDKLIETSEVDLVNEESVELSSERSFPLKKNSEHCNNVGVKKKLDPFICEYCGMTYKLKKTFLQHIRRAHVSPFICKVCKKRFTLKLSLIKHKCVQVVPRKPGSKLKWLNCKCKKIFLFEEQYLEHIKTCEKAKYLPCEECGREFADKFKLEMHVLRQHIKLKDHSQKQASLWICEVCGCHLSAVSARKHYATHSFTEKKFTCSTCEMKFTNKSALEKHVESHSDARPFICNICQATFKRKDHLKMHMKNKHNLYEDKKYECRKCKRHFTTQSYLIRHQRLHSQGVSYECVVCRSRYPTEHSLKMHQTRTKHDSENDTGDTNVSLNTADWANRFRCSICNRRYGSITSLKKHTLIHHKKVVNVAIKEEEVVNEVNVNHDNENAENETNREIIENVYECPKCCKRYLSEFGLKLHLSRSKHAPIKVVQKKKRRLIGVVKAEKNPRFKCHECNEMFGTLLSLKMHKIKRKHFSKCPSCDKRFALDFKLRNHLIKVHHRSDLEEKINEFTQAEIMPYQCDHCEQKFAMHHNYLAHVQKKHNNQNDSTALNLIYINSDVFKQKISEGETSIVYHCTECWDNFFTEEEFHNHTHMTTEFIVPDESSDVSNVVTTQVVKTGNGLQVENDCQSIPVIISNDTNE